MRHMPAALVTAVLHSVALQRCFVLPTTFLILVINLLMYLGILGLVRQSNLAYSAAM